MKLFSYKGKHVKRISLGISKWIMCILVIILCISLTVIGGVTIKNLHRQNEYNRLSETVTATEIPEDDYDVSAESEPIQEPVIEEKEPVILPQYADLYESNPDMFGWIQIEDTVLDYPVMHTPDVPEKYLRLTFDGEYYVGGTPFMDYRCTGESDNLIFYGHHMKNGTMFTGIIKYADASYWQEHPVIKFNTLYEENEYEVLAAFYDRVYYASEDCFKFYNFIDAENEADFDSAIKNYKAKALYDTGVTPEYGDQLITLVTCSYHHENGRFVVVACQKERSGENVGETSKSVGEQVS